jgi:hypothetical protein
MPRKPEKMGSSCEKGANFFDSHLCIFGVLLEFFQWWENSFPPLEETLILWGFVQWWENGKLLRARARALDGPRKVP